MRLHLKTCGHCDRFAIRVDGETQWYRRMVNLPITEIKRLHEVVSQSEGTCEECARKLIIGAGEVH